MSAARSEDGLGLVEVMVAMAIFGIVIATVYVSLSMIVARTSGVAGATTAMDQLQLAEQTVVQAVHAADSWCEPQAPAPAYGCAAAPTAAPTTHELAFTADVAGAEIAYTFTIDPAAHTLTMQKGSTTSILLTNLDPASAFSPQSKDVVAGGTTYTFYNQVGISLTVDSPRVGAPQVTRTTAADSSVEVWNVEYACNAQLQLAQASGTPAC